ncbi:acyl-CoA dehydrogenase [Sesbania bispinosa]|nr:acyl-CoA dehydrogenase [Sesbania bispinosa]
MEGWMGRLENNGFGITKKMWREGKTCWNSAFAIFRSTLVRKLQTEQLPVSTLAHLLTSISIHGWLFVKGG